MADPNLGMYPSATTTPTTSAAGSSANIGLFNAAEPQAMATAVTGVSTAFKGLSATVNDFVSTANSKIDSLIQKVSGLSKSVQGAQSSFKPAGMSGGGTGGWQTISQGSNLPNGGEQSPGWNAQGPYVQPTAGGPGVGPPRARGGGVGVGGATGGPPPPNGGTQPSAGGSFPWKTAGAVGAIATVGALTAAGSYGASQMAPMEAVDLTANRLAGGQPGPYNTAQKTRTMNQMYNALNTGGATSPQDIAGAAGLLGGATGVGPVGSQAFGQASSTAGLAAILNPGIGATGGAQMAQGLYSPQTFQKFRSLGLRPPIGPGHTLAPVQDILNQVSTTVNRGQPLTQQQAAQGFYQGSYLTSTFNQLGIDPTMAQQVLQKETQWQADPKNRGKPLPQLTSTDKSGKPQLNQGAVKALGLQDTAANALLQTQQEKMGAQENLFPGMAKAVQDFQGAVGKFWDAVNKLTGGGTGVGDFLGKATGILGGGGGLGGQGGGGIGGITSAVGSFVLLNKIRNLFGGKSGSGPTSGGKPGPKPGPGEPGGPPKDVGGKPGSPSSPRPTPKPGGGGGLWDDITGTVKDWLSGGKGGNIWTGKPGGGTSGWQKDIKDVTDVGKEVGGPPAPTPTTQTPGQTGSPNQGGAGPRLTDFQPGGASTVNALSNMADQLGIQHIISAKDQGQDDDTFHAHHNAIDLVPGTAGGNVQKDSPGLLQLDQQLAKKFGPGLVELIYGGPGGINIKNGKVVAPSVYGNKVMAQHHSHVHVSATEGSLKAAGITLQGHKSKGTTTSGGASPAPSASTSQQQGSTPAGGGSRPPAKLGEGASTMESSVIMQGYQGMQRGQGGGARQAAPTPAPQKSGSGIKPVPGNLMHATPEAAKAYAMQIAAQRGWNFADWNDVEMREAGWRWDAYNPSGAYGIPQSLPGSKMASAGPDWRDNAGTQINWMADYMQQRYQGPAGALAHERSIGWYDTGAWNIARDQLAQLHKGEMVIPPAAAEAVRKQTPTASGGGISVVFQQGAFMIQKAPISEAECEQIGNRVVNAIEKKAVHKQLVSE